MKFFDTHCHLDFPLFDSIRSDVLIQCELRHVERILIPGVSHNNWQSVIDLVANDPRFSMALGLHPCFLAQHQNEHVQYLEELLDGQDIRHKIIAIGEIGLDFWAGNGEQKRQIELLDQQLTLAQTNGLPVILHSRKSHDVLVSRLRRAGIGRGVVHAFSGSWQQAVAFIDQGMRLGLGGAVTYPRANKLREIVRRLPIEAMVLETDAPDMPLCGKQGQINRPDYLPEVFEVLCQLRSEKPEELAQQLWDNSTALFGD